MQLLFDCRTLTPTTEHPSQVAQVVDCGRRYKPLWARGSAQLSETHENDACRRSPAAEARTGLDLPLGFEVRTKHGARRTAAMASALFQSAGSVSLGFDQTDRARESRRLNRSQARGFKKNL